MRQASKYAINEKSTILAWISWNFGNFTYPWDMVVFTKFHENWATIVDFSLITYVGACLIFYSPVFTKMNMFNTTRRTIYYYIYWVTLLGKCVLYPKDFQNILALFMFILFLVKLCILVTTKDFVKTHL